MEGVTLTQARILVTLRAALERAENPRVVYRVEWWGWVPDPLVDSVEVDGKFVSGDFPRGWARSDLDALAAAGFLRRTGEWQNPDDEYDRRLTFEPTRRM